MNSEGLAVVLAAHGAPATDYPPHKIGLLMMLEFAGKLVDRIRFLRGWRDRLADQAAHWPRTAENDPYQVAVESLVGQLTLRLDCPVLAGYNEFCEPTIGDAIDLACTGGATTIVVVPTMLVRGNPHTELEIQEAVAGARERHPAVRIVYAWPFQEDLLASMLADEVRSHLRQPSQAAGD